MAAPDDPNALVGALLNQRWRLVRVLGTGGLSAVFAAEGAQGQGTYAVKLLRAEFCEDTQIIERFLAEATASKLVNHPGVVQVYEAARAEDGTPYLVLDLLQGQPLSARMNRGRVPVEQAAPILHGLLQVLGAAHRAGVIHRDLKPDNVFLEPDPSGGVRVRVLDFGIARVVEAAGGLDRKTRTGMLLGSPGYMSPEQVKSVKQADARADLWAAGVLFYEMLTGVQAFPAENDFARITAVLFGEPTPIQQVAPQYAHWALFFQRAMAREPEQRFQSAEEMADAVLTVSREGHMPVPSHHFARIPQSSVGGTVLDPAHAATAPNPVSPPGIVPERPLFGGVNTAVSAGPGGSGVPAPQVPLVQVVSPRRGIPLVLALALACFALFVGIAIGFVAGRL